MLSFLAKRLVQLIPTLFFVSILIFSLQQLLPGDPALVMAGEERDPNVIAQIRHQYRLDQPIPVQYIYWVKGVLSGDFGESLRIKVPVRELIAQKLPVTMQLASMAILIALLIGIPAGIVSAVKKGTLWDYGANLFALWGISTPNFWLGIMLIFLFSIELGWLPASGYVSLAENWRASLASTIICPHRPRQGPFRTLGHPQARHAQRADAGHHARRARTWRAAVGRGADRADLFDSRLRQADRRCGVQSRLCRGAGRRSGDGDHLHRAEPDRRYRLYPGQSTAEGLSSMTDATLGITPVSSSDELESPARRALRRLFRHKGAVVGLVVIATFAVLAVFAPLIVPYDPIATSWTAVRKPPSALHWFGTDDLGRDIFARVIYGARASLTAGAISVGIALGIGVPFGLLSGYRGGFIDALISRITDAMLACPFLILAIALAAFLGPSLGNAMIAIGVSRMPVFVRLTRGQVMSVKVEDYVEAARAMGNPRWRIALFHILPNIMPALLVQATLSIAAAIIAEAALSFLGLGQQPPAPSWGSMLNAAQRFLTNAPWMALWPGFAIFLVVLSFNLVGDGLRDALDPRER